MRRLLLELAVAALPDSVGAAKVDVTPEFPVRLCGYAARDKEPDGVAQHLFARAVAIGEGEQLALVEAVDNCAVPASIVEEVARRLHEKRGLARERFTLASTHTHTGPWLEGSIECMFGRPVPSDQLERVHRYTQWFVDRVEQAALTAIDARAPATLSWTEGRAHFAKNRRTANGPTDPALPILIARGLDGSVRAIVQSYACHCTTCGPAINQDCGDWAGYASEYVEAAHANSVALTLLGCAGDQNPSPGVTAKVQDSIDHGRAIADEVGRLLAVDGANRSANSSANSVDAGAAKSNVLHASNLVCKVERIELPFDAAKMPTRAELVERAKKNDAVAYDAQHWLEKLDHGESLPNTLSYVVQSWTWGDQLVQVFLAGEVVVDYSLRLKREFDRSRLWVSAYSNDVPCYVPSRRVLAEGGYEAESAMNYYGWPTRLAPAVEESIVAAVKRIVPPSFASSEQATRFPPPKSPSESLACIRVNHEPTRVVKADPNMADSKDTTVELPTFDVQLVASEPAIQSPVAIDFGADGTVWVCEMNDYPTGMDGKYQPGGRIVWLKDRDGDGTYESSGVFLDGLPFPTGVMAWRKGVLICAAPDILYAEDTDGDGKADVKRVLFTGFSTENYQARVNSLTWGLDGWVYGACGLFGGVITPKLYDDRGGGSSVHDGAAVDCRGRDFRIDPDRGVIEPVEGTSQQGRVRDDFGRWFGCDNSCLIFQFPLADRYVKRNPFVAAPDPRCNVLDDPRWVGGPEDSRQLFQASPKLERFNDPGDASRVTSACGIGIYRDTLLGKDVYGNAFTCEPVSNVVRRIELLPILDAGVTPLARRAFPDLFDGREFLASTDPWFRSVQAVTGPDGALWIVDMDRFVIEHPRWIPAAKLAELDVRAGAELGRIWRVVPQGRTLRRVQDLTKLSDAALLAAFETDNGTVRDLVQRELLARKVTMPGSAAVLIARTKAMVDREGDANDPDPHPMTTPFGGLWQHDSARVFAATELQRAWLREQQGQLTDAELVVLMSRPFAIEARAAAIAIAERRLATSARMADAIVEAVGDSELQRFQALLTLGECDDARRVERLAEAFSSNVDDPWMCAALLSSATKRPGELLDRLLERSLDGQEGSSPPRVAPLIPRLLATIVGVGDPKAYAKAMEAIVPKLDVEAEESWRWTALGELEQAVRRRGGTDPGVVDLARLASVAKNVELAVAAASRALDDEFSVLAAENDPGREFDVGRVLAASTLLPQHAAVDDRAAAGQLASIARFVDARAPIEVQQAAVRSLTRIADSDVPALLFPIVRSGTPALRSLALDGLMQRPNWIAATLDLVESGTLGRTCFDAVHRDRLLRSDDAALRQRAQKLFAPAGTPKRAAVVEQFRPALELRGDPTKGRATFAKLCTSCHFFRGQGHDLGPDLAALGDRSPARLLESILDPNAAVAAEYVAYDVETKSGDSLHGLVRGETSSGFTLVQANDVRHVLLRSDVASVRASRLSLMPEGLEEGLVAQDLADLIEHLRRSPAPLGDVPVAQAAAARAELKQQGTNGYARLVSEFDVFTQPSWLGPCTMHYCRQSDGASRVKWLTQPVSVHDLELANAAVDSALPSFHFRFAAAIGFASQPKGEFALALDGRELLRFDVATDDAHWSSSDGRASLDFECRAANREDATGVMTLTVPIELVHAGKPCELEVVGSAAGSQRWFGVLAPEE